MIVFEGESPQQLYREQLTRLLYGGMEVEVKGRSTKEILDVATVIGEPRRRVHVVPGRYANPFLALSEALHVLAGRNDVESLAHYNKHIGDFSDDGIHLYGAYGYRLKDQIDPLIRRLKADPNDRRAILTIWGEDDLEAETKDPPCNDLVAFKLRRERLHMTVFNRSNDIHWGLYAVNLTQFSVLQEYIAARLRVDLGYQTHISNSLHVYLDGPAKVITDRMLAAWKEPLPEIPKPLPLFPTGLPSHPEFVRDCNLVLDAKEDLDWESASLLEFANDFLRCYREHKAGVSIRLRECRHADYYSDWIMVAEEFLAAQKQRRFG